jgi:hypothetical protein
VAIRVHGALAGAEEGKGLRRERLQHALLGLDTVFGVSAAGRLSPRLTIHHTPKDGSWLNQA